MNIMMTVVESTYSSYSKVNRHTVGKAMLFITEKDCHGLWAESKTLWGENKEKIVVSLRKTGTSLQWRPNVSLH